MRALVIGAAKRRGGSAHQGLRAQRHQTGAHGGKHLVQQGRGHARFVILKQSVIKVAALCQGCRLFALKGDHLGQNRREGRKIIASARLGPVPLRPACQACKRHRKIAWHPAKPLVIALNMAQVGARHIIACPCPGKPFTTLRIGAPGVDHRLHRAAFLGPLMGRTTRHHGFLIPSKASSHLRQGLGLALMRHQFVIGRHLRPSGWIAPAGTD